MNKQEIARQQIHGAIRVYFLGGDPLVIATLSAPASQILRDLNRNNSAAISSVITEIIIKNNHPYKEFWKHYNQATANVLKHGKNTSERFDYEKFSEHDMQVGAIAFCILEFYANAGGMTPYMEAFHDYVVRRKSRRKVEKWPFSILDVLDRRITLWRLDLTSWRLNLRRAIYQRLVNILARARRRLEQR